MTIADGIRPPGPNGASLPRYGDGAETAAALFAAATVGFGTNLSMQVVNLGLQANGAGPALIGFSTMMQAVGVVLAALLTPRVMRSLGLQWTMIAGASLSGITMLAFAHTSGLIAVTALRVAYAIGLALVFSCSEYIVLSRTSERGKGHAAGMYATLTGLGMALGPAWIAVVGPTGPLALYSGALLCLTCIPVAMALGELRLPMHNWTAPSLTLFRLAPLGFVAAFIFGFVDNGPVSLLPVCGVMNGWSGSQSALLVTVVTLGAITCQWPIGRAIDRLGSAPVIRIGLLAGGLLVALLPGLWTMPPLLFLGVLGIGIVMEGFFTVGLAEIGRKVPAPSLAGANAFFVAMCGLGEIVGPAVTGSVIELLA